MNIWNKLCGYKEPKPVLDEAYWKARHEERMEGKVIVTRYIAMFGHGHYGDFCGVKEIEGFYDKTYPRDVADEPKWENTVDIFAQVAPGSWTTYWHFDINRVFETRDAAQEYYNIHVESYIRPLQTRINALEAGIELISS